MTHPVMLGVDGILRTVDSIKEIIAQRQKSKAEFIMLLTEVTTKILNTVSNIVKEQRKVKQIPERLQAQTLELTILKKLKELEKEPEMNCKLIETLEEILYESNRDDSYLN